METAFVRVSLPVSYSYFFYLFFRAKLDKKEDLVRRLLDEKNAALDNERATKDKMAQLEKDDLSRKIKQTSIKLVLNLS